MCVKGQGVEQGKEFFDLALPVLSLISPAPSQQCTTCFDSQERSCMKEELHKQQIIET